jgi:hypothetical protein
MMLGSAIVFQGPHLPRLAGRGVGRSLRTRAAQGYCGDVFAPPTAPRERGLCGYHRLAPSATIIGEIGRLMFGHRGATPMGQGREIGGLATGLRQRCAAAAPIFALALAIFLAAAPQHAAAEPSDYAIASASAALSTTQAGAHPDLNIDFELATGPGGIPAANARSLGFELPPGLLANSAAVVPCTLAQLLSAEPESPAPSGCPQDSQVGVAEIHVLSATDAVFREPLYAMAAPGGGHLARLGLIALHAPLLIDVGMRPEDHGLTLSLQGLPVPEYAVLLGLRTTVWGVPADPAHDDQRITPYEALYAGGSPDLPDGRRPSGLGPRPFLFNPTSCQGPLSLVVSTTSYALPDLLRRSATLPPLTSCGLLAFSPRLALNPGTSDPDSPSGLDLDLSLPEDGIADPGLPVQAAPRRIDLRLPPGFALNPPGAAGLAGCSASEIGLLSREPPRFDAEPARCPSAAKIGTAELTTPLLGEPLAGRLYLAAPGLAPQGSSFAAFLVLEGEGVNVKLPIRLDAGEADGLISVSVDDLPQLALSRFELHLEQGPRAVFHTPSRCGPLAIDYELASWAGRPPIRSSAPVALDRDCPTGRFAPGLSAGSVNDRAGASSVFTAEVRRSDGESSLSGLSLLLPPGLSAALGSVPLCPPDPAAAGACPPASRLGYLRVALGPGPAPLWVPSGPDPDSAVYLAGPYRGAPYSLLATVPARAGPFDFGAVTERAAVHIDSSEARARVDFEPLPRILAGVPLDYRAVRLVLDRPDFIHNPTSCQPMRVAGTATSSGGSLAALSDRFQAADCAALRFRPRVSLHLSTPARNAHPALRTTVRSAAGEADISAAGFSLPSAELLDLHRLRALCPRDLAVDRCPPDSRLGSVRIWSPLSAAPLEGPVYLREPAKGLPDLITEVRGGGVELILHGHITGAEGSTGIALTSLPDLALSKAVITLSGGRHGIIVNSKPLCRDPDPGRGEATFAAHNGKRRLFRPKLKLSC